MKKILLTIFTCLFSMSAMSQTSNLGLEEEVQKAIKIRKLNESQSINSGKPINFLIGMCLMMDGESKCNLNEAKNNITTKKTNPEKWMFFLESQSQYENYYMGFRDGQLKFGNYGENSPSRRTYKIVDSNNVELTLVRDSVCYVTTHYKRINENFYQSILKDFTNCSGTTRTMLEASMKDPWSEPRRMYPLENRFPELANTQSQPRPSQSQTNNQPNPPTQNSQSNIIWNHNNSKMKIDIVNNTINIYYSQPRQAMLDAGAKPNDLLVNGTIQNNQITGTARIFAGRCGQFTYPVTGNIFNNGREISLNGQAPVVNLSNCQVTRYVPDPLSFNVIQTNTQSNTQPPKPQANPDVEIKYTNGNFYVGQVKNGKPSGQGTLTVTNGGGGKYVGEFQNGIPSGLGTLTLKNGNSYVGEFKDGKMNGTGTYTWAQDGSKKVGTFKDDKYVGP